MTELDIAGGNGRRNRKGRAASPDGGKRGNYKRKINTSRGGNIAVFKICKRYAKTGASARNMVDYISRDGDLELLDQDGNAVQTAEERAEVLDMWGEEWGERENSRKAAHMILSTPVGSDPEAVRRAAQEWGQENLGEFNYVQTTHTDEPNPHTHFIVARQQDGPRLEWGPKEIRQMTESWADIGTRNGIPMEASSRLERGQGRKSLTQTQIHIRKRDGFTKSDLRAAEEVLGEATGKAVNPWDNALQDRLAKERAEYEDIAKALDKLVEKAGPNRSEIEATARLVRRQAMALRQVKTRRDIMRDIMRDIVDNAKITAITHESAPAELARVYAAGDSYQRQVAAPAKAEKVRREIADVRRAVMAGGLAQTKAGQTFLDKSDDGPERD